MNKTSSFTIAALTLTALTLQAAITPETKLKDYPANPKKHVISIAHSGIPFLLLILNCDGSSCGLKGHLNFCRKAGLGNHCHFNLLVGKQLRRPFRTQLGKPC